MDLVDKQHVIGFEIGQDSGQIAGPFQNRPGRLPEIDCHFTGDDVGQRGFAQSGRPEEQGMVQRFITFFGAAMKISSCSRVLCCPTYSLSNFGRKAVRSLPR